MATAGQESTAEPEHHSMGSTAIDRQGVTASGAGKSCAFCNPSAETPRCVLPFQRPSLCPPAMHTREDMWLQATAGSSLTRVPVHGASSVPPCPLALVVGRRAGCEVVAEQEQGVEALEPLQRLRQQRDGDRASGMPEVCH